MTRATGNHPTHVRSEAKRKLILDLVKVGSSVREAVEAAGIVQGTYNYYRREYPEWGREVTAARKQVGQDRQAGETRDGVPVLFQEKVAAFFPDRRKHQRQQLMIADRLDSLKPRDIFLFLMPPESGKTATLEDYMCLYLAEHPEHRFRVVSESQDLSKRIIGTCKRRFREVDDYPAFIHRFGPFYEQGQERDGKPWSAEQLTLANNPSQERDYNLVASSWTSATYGSRIDTLILDDLQSQKNYNQSEEIFRRIRGTFFNRGLEMKTLIIGTRIGPGDFYDRMLEAGLITQMEILPAADRDGEPTVPEFWEGPASRMRHDGGACCKGFRECPRDSRRLSAREYMELIRHQSGEDTWWSAYQQNPATVTRTTFGTLVDRCLDTDRLIGQLPVGV